MLKMGVSNEPARLWFRGKTGMKTLIATLLASAFLISCTPAETENRPALESVARAGGDAVVARVNGTKVFASDVDLAAQEQGFIDEGMSLPKTDARYRGVLDELIDQRLLALDAESQGLNGDRETKIRLAAARERILGNIRVERHLRDTVNEASVRRMYEEQAKLAARGDEVRARHILVEEKAKADELLKKLEAGEDFAALAMTNSIDEGSAERGGDLGYFTQDMLNGRFTRPVFNAGKGERVGPIKSEFGWHIAEVLDRRPAPQPSFEALRPKIANFMTFDAIQDLLKDLRSGAEVEILTEDGATPTETTDPQTSESEMIDPETPENE
jgi:peptidyl-prolyl cis-trans isomerase C